MRPDIEKILREASFLEYKMPSGHRTRFEEKLKESKIKKSRVIPIRKWMVAASVAIVITMGIWFGTEYYQSANQDLTTSEDSINELQLLSPELYSMESQYLQAIAYEISKLEVTDENQSLVDQYLSKIGELDNQYEILNKKLFEEELTDELLDSFIANLQLRLDLLLELKDKLKDSSDQNSKYNEKHQTI